MNKSVKKYDFDSSSDEEIQSLPAMIRSTLDANNTSRKPRSRPRPTDNRIDTVKNMVKYDKKLDPMVNFDNCTTEAAIDKSFRKKIIDAAEYFRDNNIKLDYIRSGTTGHTFKAVSTIDGQIKYVVKVCAYPCTDNYGNINDNGRPENTELRMLRLLSNFVVRHTTPHYVLPIHSFNTSIGIFINIPNSAIDLGNKNNKLYKKFISKYKKGKYNDIVSVLTCEWCSGGDLLEYIRTKHTEMKLRDWVVIFFQILYTLARTHEKYPNFKHNDMKANNILVRLMDDTGIDPNHRYKYSVGNFDFSIPHIGMQVKIWDFDFSCIEGIIDNNKVTTNWANKLNITPKKNRYYDIHFFFNTLITKRFFPEFYKGGAPQEIIEFIHRIVPLKFRGRGASNEEKEKGQIGNKYLSETGRILVNQEYTTPYDILRTDPLFSKYRFSSSMLS